VWRLEEAGGGLREAGELGATAWGARLNDLVAVEAELSEPAYAYLLALNPTDRPADREQLIPRASAGAPPERRQELRPGKHILLDDGTGLQAFAVVASRQPLPTYDEWRKMRGELPWRRAGAVSGFVWRGDGLRLDRLAAGGETRGTEVTAGDAGLMEELGRRLRGAPGVEAVAVIGFAVGPAQ
jgi:hypothetical protein